MHKKVFFVNEGKCGEANYLYDRVKTYIQLNDFEFANNILESDYLIMNTCNSSHRITKKNFNIIQRFKTKNIFIIGCGGDGNINILNDLLHLHIIPLGEEEKLDEWFYKKRKIESVNSLDIGKVNNVWTVEVSRGSMYSRNYCGIGNIKKTIHSKSIEGIVAEIQHAFKNGAKEVVLSSDDISSYGQDIGVDIFDLFTSFLQLDQEAQVACNYIDPKFVIDNKQKFIETIAKVQRISSILLPTYYNTQTLQKYDMGYTAESIFPIIQEISRLGVYTHNHLIVFYPGETFEDFLGNISQSNMYDCITFNPYYEKGKSGNYENSFFNDKDNNIKKLKTILYLVKKYPRRFNVEERIDRLISSPIIA